MEVAENGRKVTAIALLFCCFLPIYEKWKKSLKMDEKLRLWPYFFAVFFPFMKNRRKVKAIALLFCCFLPIYEK
jgi:hypothetical protein